MASCPAPRPAQSHHSDPPRALPEVTIPAFLFLLFCKIIPLGSLRPLLSPMRLTDLMSQAGVLREEPACLGAMAALSGWRRRPGCSAGPWGTPRMSPGHMTPASAGSLVACGCVPASRVLVCRVQLLTVSHRAPAFLALGSPGVPSRLFLMQRSGLASAATPCWRRVLPAPGTAGAGSH